MLVIITYQNSTGDHVTDEIKFEKFAVMDKFIMVDDGRCARYFNIDRVVQITVWD